MDSKLGDCKESQYNCSQKYILCIIHSIYNYENFYYHIGLYWFIYIYMYVYVYMLVSPFFIYYWENSNSWLFWNNCPQGKHFLAQEAVSSVK